MHRVTILSILVVLLLIINGVTLYFQFQKKDRREQGPPNPGILFKKLNLDEKQEQQFEEMRKLHFEKRDALRAEDLRLRKSMAEMISSGITDSLKIDSITNLLAANRKQYETNFYVHFQRLNAILKPEQRSPFNEILNEIIKRQAPSDRRRQQGPPPPDKP